MNNKQKYINKKIAHLTINKFITNDKVEVSCDCGTIKICNFYDLKRGRIKGCGCQKNNDNQRAICKNVMKRLRAEGKMLSGYDCSDEFTPFKYLFKCIKNKNRGKNSITLIDLRNQWESQNGICPYTKIALTLPTHTNYNKLKSFFYASIDRIDSSLPYQIGNIQFVSRNINYAKNVLSHEDFLEFLSYLKG